MKNIKLKSIFAFIVFLISMCKATAQTDKVKLSEIIKDNALLVDVRTPEEFSEGSVEGAINIPLSEVENQLSKFKEKNHIIIFCRSGNRSEKAIKILEKNGFTNLINGGSWKSVSKELESLPSEIKESDSH